MRNRFLAPNYLKYLRDVVRYKSKLYLPKRLWYNLYSISGKRIRDERFYREKRVIRGKFQDQKPEYFIIRRRPPGAGLFSNVFHVIEGIKRAEELGAKPVVDFQNYHMSQLREGRYPKHIENSWEIFFERVSDSSLAQAYSSQNYVLSDGFFREAKNVYCQKSPKWILDQFHLDTANRIITKYIQLNQNTMSQLKATETKCKNFSNLLGVSQRGGNYVEYEYYGHAKQAKSNLTFKKIDEFINNYPIDAIYLQTHDYFIWEQFKSRYGNLLIQTASMAQYQSGSKFFSNKSMSRPNHWDKVPKISYEGNLNYLIDIYMLSKARYLITSLTNGTAFAIARSFNHLNQGVHIFDLGTY